MRNGEAVDAIHVVVATALIPEPVVERMRGVVRDGVKVSYAPVPWSDTFAASAIAPEWAEPLARAHVLVGFPQQISGLVEAAPALRWVQYYGAGYEGAPLEELRVAGIGLVSAAGAGADGVAEFAVMAMLSLARRAPERFAAEQRRRWERFPSSELSGRRVTVMGAGEIGTRLCRMAAALGLHVTCVRRHPEMGCPPGADRVVAVDDILQVFADTDVVLLAAALSDDTEPLSTKEFEALQPGALLVNVGRGGLIDHDALLVAIESGALGGVWLDVLPVEPLPEPHPLWRAPRTVISSHDATATVSYPWNVARRTARHVHLWLEGGSPTHTVLPLGRPPGAS